MSHLPFIVQAMLGIGPEANGGLDRPRRNATLSSSLPATFKMNWGYCSNGSADPVASDGCTTYMGPPVTTRAGKNARWRNAMGAMLVFVAECLRGTGCFVVDIIPDDYKEEEETRAEAGGGGGRGETRRSKRRKKLSLRERELAYIRSFSFEHEDIKVFDADSRNLVAAFRTMGMDNPWICLTCFDDSVVSDRLFELLQDDFELAEVPHVREELPVNEEVIDFSQKQGGAGSTSSSFRLEAVTGDKAGSETKCSVTTRFTLYFRDGGTPAKEGEDKGSSRNSNNNHKEEKIVAEALCSYQNNATDAVGPTLEMIETAEEWQRHGLGDALMKAIHAFHCNKFGHISTRVQFSVCYVTSFYASRWFIGRYGFHDLDDMGEELGKTLWCDGCE